MRKALRRESAMLQADDDLAGQEGAIEKLQLAAGEGVIEFLACHGVTRYTVYP